jgi:intracellular septation protein
MKILLDYLPIVLFVGAYYLRDIYFATGVLIVALFVQVAILWGMTRRLPKMQLTAALLAVVLIGSHLFGDKPLIQRLLESNLHLPGPVWRRVNLMWAGFFVFCGVLNLYVAYNFDESTWVNFKLFGMLGLTFAFVLLQGLYLSRYLDTGNQ